MRSTELLLIEIKTFGFEDGLLFQLCYKNGLVSTFTMKMQKVTKRQVQCQFLGKIKGSNIFSLCQCLVPNIHNKIIERVWDTKA